VITRAQTSGISNITKSRSFLAGGESTYSSKYIIAGHSTTPFISIFAWDDIDGFIGGFSTNNFIPLATNYGIKKSPVSNEILFSNSLYSPRVRVYNWSLGFDTPYADPLPPTTTPEDEDWYFDGTKIATAQATSPHINAWRFTPGVGWGTKYANPSTAATAGRAVKFSPDGNDIILGSSLTPFIHAYSFTAEGGFGTKYASPSSLPVGYVYGLTFNSEGTDIIGITGRTSPYTFAYPWISGVGFGTKYANPVTSPSLTENSQLGTGIRFNPTSNDIAFRGYSNQSVLSWINGTGYGTKYGTVATASVSQSDIAWNSDGSLLASVGAGTGGAGISVFPFISGTGLGTKYANSTLSQQKSYSTVEWI
jgi:hypothetical protein